MPVAAGSQAAAACQSAQQVPLQIKVDGVAQPSGLNCSKTFLTWHLLVQDNMQDNMQRHMQH